MAGLTWFLLAHLLFTVSIRETCLDDLTFTVKAGGRNVHGSNYYARKGRRVDLVCNDKRVGESTNFMSLGENTNFSFYQGLRWGRTELIVKGLMQADRSDYDLHRILRGYTLSILNPATKDSKPFACTRTVTVGNGYIDDIIMSINLQILDSSQMEFCALDSVTDGVFFTGDTITLVCLNTSVDHVEFRRNGFLRTVNYSVCDTMVGPVCTVTIPNITTEMNATRLSCDHTMNNPNGDVCASVQTIFVFDSLTIVIVPAATRVANGGRAKLTCRRTPDLIANIKWNVTVNGDNVSFKIGRDFNPQYSIVLRDIEFTNDTSAEVRVTCTVTVGSRTSSANASVFYGQNAIPPSSSSVTAHSATLTTDETASDKSTTKSSFPVITVIVPVVVGTLVAITAVIYYVGRGVGGAATTTDDNVYHVDDNVALGLSADNSEVTGNVVYEPYTNDNHNMLSEL